MKKNYYTVLHQMFLQWVILGLTKNLIMGMILN